MHRMGLPLGPLGVIHRGSAIDPSFAAPQTEGDAVRRNRFGDIDLGGLPANPSPPDVWQEAAACFGIDPDVFFPTTEEEAAPALMHCAGCHIREECLAWAIKNGERYGVWGGTTEQQRRRISRNVA